MTAAQRAPTPSEMVAADSDVGPPPDLHDLVRRFGGYDKIRPEAWAEWDQLNEQWQARRREYLERRVAQAARSEHPLAEPCHCGKPGEFGYKDQSGSLVWFCVEHRLAECWADARNDVE